MTREEIRKRLEEAEANYVGYHFSPNERPEISSVRTAFYAGAEHGYKEAIKVAKEWLLNNADRYESEITGAVFHQQLAKAFETYMNKLWEEKK